jgi:hypothetical protein
MPDKRLIPPGPTPPVAIDLLDGKPRFLRYSISTLTSLKAKMGRSLFGRGGALQSVDEEVLPLLILAGLRNEDMTPAEDVTVAQIQDLPASYFPYLLNVFALAFNGSLPEQQSPNPLTASSNLGPAN